VHDAGFLGPVIDGIDLTHMGKAKRPVGPEGGLTLDGLVRSIRGVEDVPAARASRAVYASLTLPIWLMGTYIAEHAE
jgi:hypothetical protein